MIILGLDTSTRAASVALWSDGDLLGELVIEDPLTKANAHVGKFVPTGQYKYRRCRPSGSMYRSRIFYGYKDSSGYC